MDLTGVPKSIPVKQTKICSDPISLDPIYPFLVVLQGERLLEVDVGQLVLRRVPRSGLLVLFVFLAL